MNTEQIISTIVREVPPSGIRKFFDIASEMKDCISLGVGEPDFDTPWNIRESAIYALESGRTHYTSNYGSTEVRNEILHYLDMRFSLRYDMGQVVVTVGASEALDLAFRAIMNPGDEVLVPAPSYVSYMPGVSFAGGIPVPMKLQESENFKITPKSIRDAVTDKTKAIVVAFPNNPTGAIMTKEDYEQITDVIIEKDLLVISDEVYAELTYGRDHCSIASLPGMLERTVVINGFSKAFAMTGFRLGYAAGPKPVIDAMVKIHQYSMLCASVISQDAGVEALRSECSNGFSNVRKMVAEYNRRRRLMFASLNEMGLKCFEPLGAFYIYPNISSTGLDSEEFCRRLLFEKKVACVPGTAFGKNMENFIRCSYASSYDNLKEALKRIQSFINSL
ncbi:MAG: aminotransferase class I/II-fold pyridoxal phosphate-dependent enzyme [Eubacteriales bacterium]|nr:aminotransferase class I/II-fold pyridoxal phosphate-dependent enzyme [Eubacteriales bacterium]